MSIVTLTTDFGTGSPYVAAMKGVILSINPGATLVDITHDVRAQDIRHGAMVLADVADRFPPETIHVAVVDPGVGTDRAIVCAQIGRQRFVAPDNGLLSLVAHRQAPSQLVRLAEPAYWLPEVSATFHGRDVMAPVAGWLSLGIEPSRLGPPLERLVELAWPEPRRAPGILEGEVLDVDSFGNLITNITADMLPNDSAATRVFIELAGQRIEGISRTYSDRAAGQLIALIGSNGRLEVALVGGNAAATLGIGVGAVSRALWRIIDH